MNYKELCEDIINTLNSTIEEFKEEQKIDKYKTYTAYEIIQLLESIVDIEEEYKTP